MITSCAWCKKILGDNNKDDGLLSHGICKKCAEELMSPVFQVFYRKEPTFRLDEMLTIANLLDSHVYVKDIKARDVGVAWIKMQGENWSPNGEASEMLKAKGLSHTSMSIGDVFCNKKTGDYSQVDVMGFEYLPE